MEKNIPTPHINAKEGDFGKTVLMPGDPLRAKFIADNFLEDAVLVNNVRGVQGYTGYYKGKKVSVMASGMGMPAIGIYSFELFNFYGVESIIRVGSAGGMVEKVKVRDLVVGISASTNSNFQHQFQLDGHFAPTGDFDLAVKAKNKATELGVDCHVGNIYSSDTFYDASLGGMKWAQMGCLAVEMESAALYMTAAKAGKKALCICTISDHLITGEKLSAEERQNSFTDMMKVALEIAEA
ncbi:MAG: purine-nucleoside phosphorylase [Bacillota bacterium]